MVDPVFAWIARVALALLFAAAAWHKLRDARAFDAALRGYRLLPDGLARPAARGLAATEACVCAALLAPPLDPFGPAAALGLLALYSGAIGWNLARGRRDIDCGCLGPAGEARLSPQLLARNAAFALGAGVALAQSAPRTLGWIDALSVAGGVAVVVLVFAAADALRSLGERSTA